MGWSESFTLYAEEVKANALDEQRKQEEAQQRSDAAYLNTLKGMFQKPENNNEDLFHKNLKDIYDMQTQKKQQEDLAHIQEVLRPYANQKDHQKIVDGHLQMLGDKLIFNVIEHANVRGGQIYE